MFSATLHSPEVRALADKICQNPIIVDLKGKDAVPETGGQGGGLRRWVGGRGRVGKLGGVAWWGCAKAG